MREDLLQKWRDDISKRIEHLDEDNIKSIKENSDYQIVSKIVSDLTNTIYEVIPRIEIPIKTEIDIIMETYKNVIKKLYIMKLIIYVFMLEHINMLILLMQSGKWNINIM